MKNLLAAAYCGLLYAFTEALALAERPYWTGFDDESWAVLVGAGLVAAAAVFSIRAAGGAVTARTSARMQRIAGITGDVIVAAVGVFIAALAWTEIGYLATVLLVCFFAFQIGLRFGAVPYDGYPILSSVVWIAGPVSGLAVLHWEGVDLLWHTKAASVSQAVSVVWFAALTIVAAGHIAVQLKSKRFYPISAILVLLGAVAAPIGFFWRPAVPAENPKPNLLFVTADTMRADYSSLYGGKTHTPHLEALAARGTMYEKFYSLSPWTIPSFDGLFASKYPPSVDPRAEHDEQLKQLNQYDLLKPYWFHHPDDTFLDKLRAEGYKTGAVVANFAMFAQKWLLDEFDESVVFLPRLMEPRGFWKHLPVAARVVRRIAPDAVEERPFDTTRRVTRYAELLLDRSRGGPFFYWIHFVDPHSPYSPPDRFRAPDVADPYFPMPGKGFKEDFDPEVPRAHYRGEIRYVDEAVGRIVDRLETNGLTDTTYVCFFSDHGEELWDHWSWGHGHTLYEEQIHVPFILAGPGVTVQRIAPEASAIDVIPTFARLLDLEQNEEWRGAPLNAVIEGPTPVGREFPRAAFSQAMQVPSTPTERFAHAQSVVVNGYKLVRNVLTNETTLRHLPSDPGEIVDLSEEKPELARKLLGLLDDWSASFPTTFTAVSEEYDVALEYVDWEVLRAVGYIE